MINCTKKRVDLAREGGVVKKGESTKENAKRNDYLYSKAGGTEWPNKHGISLERKVTV